MERSIAREACRSGFRKTFPMYAIEAPDTSSQFEKSRPFSTHDVSRLPGLTVSTTSVATPLVLDEEKTHGVSTHSSGGVSTGPKECSALAPSAPSSTFPLRNCISLKVEELNPSPTFQNNASSCSAASVVETPSHRRGFLAHIEVLTPALHQRGTFSAGRTAGNGRSPHKSASSGSLTCRIRQRHSRAGFKTHLLPRVQFYNSFQAPPIPTYTKDTGSSGWRMRLRTHVIRRPVGFSDELASTVSSTWAKSAATLGRIETKKQHFVLGDAQSEYVDSEMAQRRNMGSRLARGRLAPAALAPSDGVSRSSGPKTHLSQSSPPSIRYENEVAPVAAKRIRPEDRTHFVRKCEATSNLIGSNTSNKSTRSQHGNIDIGHETGSAECGDSNCKTNFPNKMLHATDHNNERTVCNLPPPGAQTTLAPLLLSYPTRLKSARDKEACVLSPRPLGTASPLKNQEAVVEKFAAEEGSNGCPRNTCSAGDERKPDILSEQSCGTLVPSLLSASETLAESAIQKKKHPANLAEHSTALREESQHSFHATQHVVQHADTSTSGADAGEPKTQNFLSRAQVIEEAEEGKGVTARSTDVTSALQEKLVIPFTQSLKEAASAPEMPVASTSALRPTNSPLVQQATYAQRPLMPPPSPPCFLIPLQYRLPPPPVRPYLPETGSLSLDEEERNARPGTELGTLGSSTHHTESDDLQGGGSSRSHAPPVLTGPDALWKCASERGGADVGVSSTVTSPGNFGATGGPPATSATGANHYTAFDDAPSAPPSAAEKASDITNSFLLSTAYLKTQLCLSPRTSSAEKESKALSRISERPGRQPPGHNAGDSSEVSEGSHTEHVPYQGPVSETVTGDAYESCIDVEPQSSDYPTARHSGIATISYPHRVGLAVPHTSGVLQRTPVDSPSKQQSEVPSPCVVPVAGENKGKKSRALTWSKVLALESIFPHVGSGKEQANRCVVPSAKGGRESTSRLAQDLNLSPRSHVTEERPRYTDGSPSTLHSLSQHVLRQSRPLQRRYCLEAHSLPSSPISHSYAAQQRQKCPHSKAGLRWKQAKFTRLPDTVSKDNPAFPDCPNIMPTSNMVGEGGESLQYTRCEEWETHGFLSEKDTQRLIQHQLSAREGCCRVPPYQRSARFGICSPTRLLYGVPRSFQHTVPPAKRLNTVLPELMSCDTGQHLRFRSPVGSSFCEWPPVSHPRSTVCSVHLSPRSEIAPRGRAAGYTGLPAAQCANQRSPCKPDETTQQRSRPRENHPPIQSPEKRAVILPCRTRCIFQCSGQERDCNSGARKSHFETFTAVGAATTISEDEIPRIRLRHFVEGSQAPQTSATAASSSVTPLLVGSKACHTRQSVATRRDVKTLHVSRTHTHDFASSEEDIVELTKLSEAIETCPSSLSIPGDLFQSKTAKGKPKYTKEKMIRNRVRPRGSLRKDLHEGAVAPARYEPLPANNGRDKVSSSVPSRPAVSDSFCDVKPQENTAEKPAPYSFVATVDPVKPATNTARPSRYALGILWSCHQDRLEWVGQKPQHTSDRQHLVTFLASPSSTDLDVRKRDGGLNEQAAAIRRSEGLQEVEGIYSRGALSALHSVGGTLCKRQRGLCGLHQVEKSKPDATHRRRSEEAAEDGIHHAHSENCSVESTTWNADASTASESADSPPRSANVDREKRNAPAPACDSSRGIDGSRSRRKTSSITAGPAKLRKKPLQWSRGTYTDQRSTRGHELRCGRSSPGQRSARRKYAEWRRTNSWCSSRHDPPSPDGDPARATDLSASPPRSQTSTSPEASSFAEPLLTLLGNDIKERAPVCSPTRRPVHCSTGQAQIAHPTVGGTWQKSAQQVETGNTATKECRVLCTSPLATSQATINGHRDVGHGVRARSRRSGEQTHLEVDKYAVRHRVTVSSRKDDSRPHASSIQTEASTFAHGREGHCPLSSSLSERHNGSLQKDGIPLEEAPFHANVRVEQASQYLSTAEGRCSSPAQRGGTGQAEFPGRKVDMSVLQLHHNRDVSTYTSLVSAVELYYTSRVNGRPRATEAVLPKCI